LGELIVALAGPFSNLLLAFIGTGLLVLLTKIYGPVVLLSGAGGFYSFLYKFLYLFSVINVGLAIFNLLPLPPLDGYRLIKFFFPEI
jgi:Zn-dependent protease